MSANGSDLDEQDELRGYYAGLNAHMPQWALTDEERAEAEQLTSKLVEVCEWLESNNDRVRTLVEIEFLARGSGAGDLFEAEDRLIRVFGAWETDGVGRSDKVGVLLRERCEAAWKTMTRT